MNDTIMAFIGFAVVCSPLFILLYAAVVVGARQKEYMAQQRQTDADKKRMHYFMQIVMKEYYDKYTYVAGDYSIPVSRYTRKFFTYIVCFNEKEMAVVSYKVQNGAMVCKNVLPIDKSSIKMKYKVSNGKVKLEFKLGKTKMCVTISPVVDSAGEGDAAPIGICQEKEVALLIQYLQNGELGDSR